MRLLVAIAFLLASVAALGQSASGPTGGPNFNVTSPTNGQCFVFQSVTNTWTNQACPGGVSPPIPLSDLANQNAGTIVGRAAGAGSGTPTILIRPSLYAQDYGAKCDNATDDTSALNTFFTAVGTSRWMTGVLPPGVCRFSSLLSFPANNSSIVGAGRDSTWLFYVGASTTTDLVGIIGGSISVLAGPGNYSGFSIASATTMTGGAALHIKWAAYLTLSDFSTGSQNAFAILGSNTLFHGIQVDASGQIYLNNFEASYDNGEGLRVFGGGVSAPPQYDLFVNNCIIQGNSGTGVHVGGGWDGANFDACTVVGNQTNVVIDHALSAFGNQEILFGPRFYANAPTGNASNVGDNYLINDSDATATNLCNITIAGPVTLSPHENGINVQSWPACPVNVNSTTITNNAKSGIYIQDTTSLVNVSATTNISSNSRYGIEGSASTSNVKSLASISGNTLGSFLNVAGNASGFPYLSGTTGSIGGSALLAGQCSTGTVSITGATTGMAVVATPVTYPTTGNFWQAYVSSANTVTVAICAAVADTPTASTYNVRVLQ